MANRLTMVGGALLMCCVLMGVSEAIRWDNMANLEEHFRLLWNVRGDEITFEMQVKTHGYIGFGFSFNSTDPSKYRADLIIGWVDGGETFYQVCTKFELNII